MPASHTPAPASIVVDVNAEKKAVPVILPARVDNSFTRDVYELPAETVNIAVDGFPVPACTRVQGKSETSFMYSNGVYVEAIDEKTAPCS